jgi:hypothetical protein
VTRLEDVPHLPKKEVRVPQQVLRVTPEGATGERIWYFYSETERDSALWLQAIDVNKAIATYLKSLASGSVEADTRILALFTAVSSKVAYLDDKVLDVAAAAAVAIPVSHFQHLHTLSMRAAKLGAAHLACFAGIANHRGLKTLLLGANPLGPAGIKTLCGILAANTTVSALGLDATEADEAAALDLAALLSLPSVTITSLDLTGNRITSKGAAAIVDAFSRSRRAVKTWSFGGNLIDDEGAQHLAQAISAGAAVTSLDLSRNHVSSRGAQALASCLGKTETLVHLSLAHNKIGESGCASLANAFAESFSIITLDLSSVACPGREMFTAFSKTKFLVDLALPAFKLSRRPLLPLPTPK